MDKYHIGTRLCGEPRNYVKDIAFLLKEKSGKDFTEKIVPHMTYIRPFTTDNEEELKILIKHFRILANLLLTE